MVGLLTGLAVALWTGFGGPKPTPPTLPLDVDGCSSNLTTFYKESSFLQDAVTTAQPQELVFLYSLNRSINSV